MSLKCIVFHRGVCVAGRLVGLRCRKLNQLEEERSIVFHGGESEPRGMAVIFRIGAHCIIFFQRECSGKCVAGECCTRMGFRKGCRCEACYMCGLALL